MELMISVPGFTVWTEWDCVGNGVQTHPVWWGPLETRGPPASNQGPAIGQLTFPSCMVHKELKHECSICPMIFTFRKTTCSKCGDWPTWRCVLPRSKWRHSQMWGWHRSDAVDRSVSEHSTGYIGGGHGSWTGIWEPLKRTAVKCVEGLHSANMYQQENLCPCGLSTYTPPWIFLFINM